MTRNRLATADLFVGIQRDPHATDDEIDRIKQLHDLKSNERRLSTTDGNPSMIIDHFLYHGDYEHATNALILEELQIQHIISISDFPLPKDLLDKYHVLWIKVDDMPHVMIRQHFDQTNEILRVCRESNERVLVHCQMGISRSSTIVLAYLLKYCHTTLHEAYDYLLQKRPIALPNNGFLLQLIRYEENLRKTNPSLPTPASNDVHSCTHHCV